MEPAPTWLKRTRVEKITDRTKEDVEKNIENVKDSAADCEPVTLKIAAIAKTNDPSRSPVFVSSPRLRKI